MKFTVIIFLFFFSISSAQQPKIKIEDLASQIANLESKHSMAQRLWTLSIIHIHQHLSKLNNKIEMKYSNPEFYFSLSNKKRAVLKNQYPMLKLVEQIWNKKEKEKELVRVIELKKILEEERKLNPQAVKNLIIKYQTRDIDLSDEALDLILGINYEETEKKISLVTSENWELNIGQTKALTQTPYKLVRDIAQVLDLTSNDTFYDLGSGYGRVLIYLSILFPKAQFKGIELMKDRVQNALEIKTFLNLNNLEFKIEDALHGVFSDATYFYFYNPFPSIMDKVLKNIELASQSKKISIFGLGGSNSFLDKQIWLTKTKVLDESWNLSLYVSSSIK